jgi:ABC-type antimicrobial peptide transport system permease subunit
VAVVSNAFAQQFWPGADAVGNVISTPDNRRLTVIGVVADTRSEHFGIVDGPRLYTLRDAGALDGDLYVRFTGSTKAAENAVRDALKSLDPAEIDPPKTVWESLETSTENMRSLARIILVMASIAVLMAITGIYGVLSFAVSRRTREFGIKMMLGADRSAIFRSIISRGIQQITIGVICGVAIVSPAVWILTRLLKDSPLPLKIFDTPVNGIAAVLVVLASLVAMFVPAVRATQVDPMKALTTE